MTVLAHHLCVCVWLYFTFIKLNRIPQGEENICLPFDCLGASVYVCAFVFVWCYCPLAIHIVLGVSINTDEWKKRQSKGTAITRVKLRRHTDLKHKNSILLNSNKQKHTKTCIFFVSAKRLSL